MEARSIHLDARGSITDADQARWRWTDVVVSGDADDLLSWGDAMGIDRLALVDAVADSDQPKYDDLGDHVAFTIHAPTIGDDGIAPIEVDCIVHDLGLLTIHAEPTPGLDWMWGRVADRPDWRRGPDTLFVAVLDVITRRFVPVVEDLDRLADELALDALSGKEVAGDITTLRMNEADVRRMLAPLGTAIDAALADDHPLLSKEARRRMRDVRDVVSRLLGLLDSARGVLGDALAVYHGMASHRMARATTVFTVYAALMLPLTFITGFFGMNFVRLPGTDTGSGWLIAVGLMVASLGVSAFVFWRAGLLTPERTTRPSTTELLKSAVTAPIRAVGSLTPRRAGSARTGSE